MKRALLIVDMQEAFFNTPGLAGKKQGLVAACNQLIRSAKQTGTPVFLVRTVHKRDKSTWTLNMLDDNKGFLFEGDSDTDYATGLETEGTYEIIKTRDSAFWQTNLLSILKKHGVGSILLAGVSTHACVAETARDAYNAGLRVEIAASAVDADKNRYHQVTLDMLQDEYRMKITGRKTSRKQAVSK